MHGGYKKLSSHGSINIPVQMRRALGLQTKDPMEVEESEGAIIIRPYVLRCSFCGTSENVKKFYGKGICRECAQKAYDSYQKELGGKEHG